MLRPTVNPPNEFRLARGDVIRYSRAFLNYRVMQIWPRHAPTKTRAKRFLHNRILHTDNGTSSFQLERSILACGDISPNPGPARERPAKYPCGECGNNVRSNQDAILCSSCNTWSHAQCLHLSKDTFRYYLAHTDIDWTCTPCALPKFSDSFFLEKSLDELNVSNNTDTSVNSSSRLEDETRLMEREEQDSVSWFEDKIGSYYKSNLKIAYLNINSIHNKIDEVKQMLNKNLFDIMFIAETKIDSTVSDALLSQPGYKIMRRDRKKGAGGLIA